MTSDLMLREALDRIVPVSDEVAKWEDVLQRAGVHATCAQRASHRSRRPIIALSFVAFLILAGAALAVGLRFLRGDPAPAPVKNQVRLSGRPPRGFILPGPSRGNGVESGKTYAAGVINASTGPVYLWVAPTLSGGYCAFIQIVGLDLRNGQPNIASECEDGKRALSLSISGANVNGRMLYLAHGHTRPSAKHVRFRFRDGTTLLVGIYRGFFITELPAGASSVAEVQATDESGRVLARQRFHTFKPLRRAQGPWRTVLQIESRQTHRPITLATGPGAHGTRCTELRVAGTSSGSCQRFLPKPRAIEIAATQIGRAPVGTLILSGLVGSQIKSVSVQFEDGSTAEVTVAHGYALYQVARANYLPGHRPVRLVGRDARGAVVTTSHVR